MQKTSLFLLCSALIFPAAVTVHGVSEPAPKIVCNEPIFRFGERDNSETVAHDFVVRNEGETSLEILGARPSCGCTVADISTKLVPPGSSTVISAKLNLQGRRGEQHKTITVQSNDPAQPQLMLVMEGVAKAQVNIQPMRVFVRDLKQGETNVSTVEITADTPEPLKIEGVTSSSPLVKAEVETVEEGRRFLLRLTTTDAMPRGLTSGQVTVRTDSRTTPAVAVPFHYQVIGELVVAPEQITFREADDQLLSRNVIVKPGLVKEFSVESVEAPLPSIVVNIRQMGVYGYQIQLSDIPASMELDGKEVLIITSVEPMREIRIPFHVIPSRN